MLPKPAMHLRYARQGTVVRAGSMHAIRARQTCCGFLVAKKHDPWSWENHRLSDGGLSRVEDRRLERQPPGTNRFLRHGANSRAQTHLICSFDGRPFGRSRVLAALIREQFFRRMRAEKFLMVLADLAVVVRRGKVVMIVIRIAC